MAMLASIMGNASAVNFRKLNSTPFFSATRFVVSANRGKSCHDKGESNMSHFGKSAAALSALTFCAAAIQVDVAHARAWRLRVLESLCSDYQCSYPPGAVGRLTMDASGDLFGVTTRGGVHGGGSVFRLYREPGKTKWRFRTIYNFCALQNCADGEAPEGGVIAATDGNLYGTTNGGGSTGAGTFFRLTSNKNGKYWLLTSLYNFCTRNSACTDGGGPAGGLTYKGAAAGLPYDFSSPLYGTNQSFGGHGAGVAYALTPWAGHQQWAEKVLYRFCSGGGVCEDGRGGGPLLLDSAGNLDGISDVAGVNSRGVAYKLSPSDGRKWIQTLLYSFCSEDNCTDGADPAGGLVEDAAGNLLGLTYDGGNPSQCDGYGCGILYEIAADGSESTLYRFCSLKKCLDGDSPAGALYFDTSGNLYGATEGGGKYADDANPFGYGTVFQFANGSLDTLRSFCGQPSCVDGEYPVTGVVMDSTGDLFGTTSQGGATNDGTIFELEPRQ